MSINSHMSLNCEQVSRNKELNEDILNLNLWPDNKNFLHGQLNTPRGNEAEWRYSFKLKCCVQVRNTHIKLLEFDQLKPTMKIL